MRLHDTSVGVFEEHNGPHKALQTVQTPAGAQASPLPVCSLMQAALAAYRGQSAAPIATGPAADPGLAARVAGLVDAACSFASFVEVWPAQNVLGLTSADQGIVFSMRSGEELLLVSPDVPYAAVTEDDFDGKPFSDSMYRIDEPPQGKMTRVPVNHVF